ncbi:hypothetical protein TNCV_1095731 [Trichonephila clavipes]|nr:hypothetical protein TNCV_1095731 [Trichonephila clavipes]
MALGGSFPQINLSVQVFVLNCNPDCEKKMQANQNILSRHLTSRARFCFLLPDGTLKPVLAHPFLEEFISERREVDSKKNPSPLLSQAVTPIASGLRRHQLVPEQHSPQTPPSPRENFF